MKQDLAIQLTTLEAKRKRWQTRLRRAVTELDKIERKRKRLLTPPKIGQPKLAKDLTEVIVTSPLPDLVQAIDDSLTAIIEDRPELNIPNFLSRNPDAGSAIAAKRTEVDKKKMPLSGRDALAAIKAQSDKVTARRKKKELQLR